MIYTVTFNPALDYAVQVDGLNMGKTNRSTEESLTAGGKGINVSVVLKNLGEDSVALGFIAGFTGKQIEKMTASVGVKTDFIEIDGLSRINLKLKTGEETEISCTGPEIPEEAFLRLTYKLDTLTENDFLVLAGSVPPSLGKDAYAKIMERVKDKGVKVVVDATGELLLRALPYRPFLIKPNAQELGELFGITVADKQTALTYAKRLQDMGAQNVIVSMGKDGAVMASNDGELLTQSAPEGKVINTVGSGDSLVAGFIHGLVRSKSLQVAFKTGVAAGSASAFCKWLATKEQVQAVLEKM